MIIELTEQRVSKNNKSKSQKIKTCVYDSFVLCLLLGLTACASLKNKSPALEHTEIPSQDIQLFESAFHDLGVENYSSAIPQLEKLAEKYKGQSLEWPSLYNLGSAYKETGQCAKAKTLYEQLMAHTHQASYKLKQKKHRTAKVGPYPLAIKPQLYLSLSYVYECLGEREKRLKILKEGESYTSYLKEEVRLIEYPARLSLAYMEMDEQKKGFEIQQQLYQNLEVLKQKFRISSAADESFALYFYTIGRSHIRPDQVLLDHFLKVFPYHQTYLVQAVLLQAGKWSIRAEKELGDLYRKMWMGLKKQKNKSRRSAKEVQKILNQLKQMVEGTKNQKMRHIYRVLRKKTLKFLKA